MSAYKIFISSPGDVGRERHLTEQVIRRVAAEFQDRVEVQPYFWEYEPMESTRDYQENIPLTSDFDLVICILWKRLGSPLSAKRERPGGGRWRSGTEFELVTAVESKKERGAPDIFIFKNDTKPTFEADEEGEGARTELDLAQWKALIAFIKEWCEGVQDGQRVFTAALNRYQALDQFEQVLERLLVGKLNERFPPAPDPSDSKQSRLSSPAPTWTQGSPFRGLEAFQFLHASIFCGRTHAIGEVLERLRRKAAQGRPFVLILGASGSGKSSLAMAGVLPLLVKPGTIEGVSLWRRVVFRPGGQTEVGDLFDRLAAALVRQQEGEGLPELISGSITVEQLAADLRADPKAAALLIRSALNQVAVLYREAEAQKLRGWIAESQAENRTADVERYGRLLADLTPRQARLALVIDQAEELFTSDELNRRPELRNGFAVALNALAASGVVFALATLRSDFYSQIQQLPAFVDLKEADGQFDLLPAQPAEIAQMIRQPAIAAGLKFEKDPQTQEGLDEILADQVKAEPRLLPLLEFALDELYKQRTADGLLTLEAYRVHLDGSIVRALAKRADATLEGLSDLSRDAFRSVMRRLATTVDDTAVGSAHGPPLEVIAKGPSSPAFQRQRVPYDELTAYPPGAKALVDAFVAARLLVVETGKTDDQKAEVTVAHEALFEHWAALKNLLLAERDDLILPRARVAASHERWRVENRTGDFLLPPGKQLSEAEQLLAEYGDELTPELKTYVAASMTQAHAQRKRRQRLLVAALAVFAALAIAASGAALWAIQQRSRAEQQTQLAIQQQGRAEQQTQLAIQQRGRAEQQTQLATARQLAAQAQVGAVRTPYNLLLALESISITQKIGTFSPTASRQLLADLLNATGGIPLQHAAPVAAVAFSPDDRWLAAASAGVVQLWDMQAPSTAPITLGGQNNVVNALAFSPDGRTLAIVGDDTGVRMWDMVTANRAASARLLETHSAHLVGVAFSRNGRWLATASRDDDAQMWDLTATDPATATSILPHDKGANTLAFSPDNRWLATGSSDGTVRMWDLLSPNPSAASIPLPNMDVRKVAFSPNSQWLVAGDTESYTVVLMRVAAPDQQFLLKVNQWALAVAFSPDGRWLATPSQYDVRLWDLNKPDPSSEPLILPGHKNFIADLAFSPDGKWFATGSADHTVQLWSVADRFTAPAVLRGHEGPISGLAFSHDSRHLATASADRTVRLWNTSSPAAEPLMLRTSDGATAELHMWDIRAVDSPEAPRVLGGKLDPGAGNVFSPDGKWIATIPAGGVDFVDLWKLSTPSPTHYRVHHPGGIWASPVFSPDGRWLATGGVRDPTVRLWDLKSPNPQDDTRLLRGHKAPVRSLAFSADGRRLVSGARDGFALVWDLTAYPPPSPKKLAGGDIKAVAISADGRHVVTGSWEPDYDARIWDLSSPVSSSNPIKLTFAGRVFDVAISPDGRWVAAGSWDITTQLLDLSKPGTKPFVLKGHTARTLSVAFSPDSQWLATGNEDQTARLWNLAAADPSLDSTVLQAAYDVGSVSFSPDGRWLALNSTEYRINPFSPDGNWFVSSSTDTRLYHVRLEDLILLTCRTAGRNLTKTEWELSFGDQPYRKTCPQLP